LGAVIHSTHLEEKFENEEAIVKALLGDDLSFEKIKNFEIAGWLLKRSMIYFLKFLISYPNWI